MMYDSLENAQAYDGGLVAGREAGAWIVTEDNAADILRALEECELDIPNPLSGEWAGESIPELSSAYGLDLADKWVADTFESGYYDGYCERVELDALAYTKEGA